VKDFSQPHSITLDAEGFRMRHGDDAEDAYLWKDVENFRVGGEFETYQPVFDLVSRRGRNRKSGDYDVAIGDSYGMGSTDPTARMPGLPIWVGPRAMCSWLD